MEKIEPRTLKGFRDFAPKEQLARQAMFRKIQSAFERFGFLPLSTPVLEYKEILMGKYGEDEKLIYSFKDNGERDVAMRYDLTVPLARFVAQNQGQLTYPFKRYQIAPVWRAENTQKGRLREFYQCDVDVVGSESSQADSDVVACLCKALESVGIHDYKVRLNDRRNFDVFGDNPEKVIRALDKLEKIGRDAVLAEIEMQDPAQVEPARDYIDGVLALAYQADLEKLRAEIVGLGVPGANIVIDRNIARGLDYYTSTVFEIFLPDSPEFGSICSGGRYDGLLNTFSAKSLPAVGGSIGIDRLFEALESMDRVPTAQGVEVVVLNMGEKTWPDALRVAAELRDAQVNTDLYYDQAKLDKQLKYAEGKGARLAVFIGEEEKAGGVVKIKNLQTREQVEVSEGDLLSAIRSI